jgi:hypothetical protein
MKLTFRRRLAVLVALAVGLAIALAVVSRNRPGEKPPTLAQLAAKNYRTLSARESRRLLQYAEREYQCLAAHGTHLSAPVASSTRITMSAPGKTAGELARAMLPCVSDVGPPPPKASLQARPHQVLVYLPKRCLMNPQQLPQTRRADRPRA